MTPPKAVDVSVIVPVYNDPDGIRATLKSLVDQTLSEFQVIVVDNDSTDSTPEVVRSFERKYEAVVLHSETDVQSSYAARNTGINNSSSDILSFVDADMTVPEDWLESALEVFDESAADYMGCNVNLTLPDEPSLAARYDYHTGFPVQQYLDRQRFVPTCCLFVRREVFEDVGLFDSRLVSGGDKEFGNRVHDAGHTLHYAGGVIMYHPTRDTVNAHIRKNIRVGRGLCQLQRLYPDRYGRPGIPPRPSGIKSLQTDLKAGDRIGLKTLSTALIFVRAMGYYSEYINPSPPTVDDRSNAG